MASASHKQKVQLYLYDLSQGMAKLLSAQFLGKQIDGIWHTGIVVFGHEYYYGGGIQAARPGCTMAGQPVQVIDLGETEVTQQVFHDWLHSVSPRFTPETYSLLTHNCNNFTSECSKFLTGKDIPAFITGLPEEALNTPLGMMLRPVISQMESQMKQSVGMAVPWQEQGGSGLNLPPIQTAHNAAAAPSSPVPSALSTSHRVAQDSHSASNPAATEERKAAESGHFHATLKLPALLSSSKPLLSSDQKAKSFETLMKTQSKKFGDKGLTDPERTVLANAVAHLETSAPFSAQEVTEIATLFDRLIRGWPASGQFPVLGILRLLVLRDEIRAHYLTAYQTKQTDAVEVLLRFIHNQAAPTSAAEESKAEMPLSTQLMALCSLSNLFASADFGRLLAVHETVVDAALHVMTHKEQSMRALGAALLYNIGLFLPKDDSDVVVRVANALVHLSQTENDEETCYRLMCALGQVLYCNDSGVALIASLEYNAAGVAARFSSSRLKSIADDITTIVASLEML